MTAHSAPPFNIRHLDRIVGLFLSVAIILAAGGILLILQMKTELYQDGYAFHSILTKTHGIAVDSQIKLSGIAIGKVRSVALRSQGDVRIDFVITHKYRAFLTQGSYLDVAGSFGVGAF